MPNKTNSHCVYLDHWISGKINYFFYLLKMNENVIIILAAGASSRMERPKQLLPYHQESLLSHTIGEAQKSLMAVMVVLGANAQEIETQTRNLECKIVVNEDWKSGISSSIKAGLKKALAHFKGMQHCILAVCDQPYISSVLFRQLVDQKKKSGKKIVACSYAGTSGTPCLFDKKYFEELLQLEGDHGAKSILQKYRNDVALVEFEKGELDVDTNKDYEEFLKNQKI
jgi:molybdenum cofactor cytidylyltransferase